MLLKQQFAIMLPLKKVLLLPTNVLLHEFEVLLILPLNSKNPLRPNYAEQMLA